MDRIVDPNKFILLAAVTDWLAVYRRHAEHAPSPEDLMRERKLELARIVQLRWLSVPDLGYPTEPFQVWRRPAFPVEGEKDVEFTPGRPAGPSRRRDRPAAGLRTSGHPVERRGFSDRVRRSALRLLDNRHPVAECRLQLVIFSGPAIQCFVISPGASLQSLTGLDALAQNDPKWELVEIVGLPVNEAWNGLQKLDAEQGLITALGDPRDAALDRFRRGAPFYGWDAQITPALPAPPWQLADPQAMLKVIDESMLDPLREMISSTAPQEHASFTVSHTLPMVGGDPAKTVFKPLNTLLFGAATDPLASLVSSYGTAFEDVDIPSIQLGDRTLFDEPGRSDWDYMVTARYESGLDGASGPLEYAAMVFSPAAAVPPPVPGNLVATSDGLRAPETTDADWRGVLRVSWDKVDALPFRVGSYAFARARLAPAGAVQPLMDRRPPDSALQPISATSESGAGSDRPAECARRALCDRQRAEPQRSAVRRRASGPVRTLEWLSLSAVRCRRAASAPGQHSVGAARHHGGRGGTLSRDPDDRIRMGLGDAEP